MHQAKMHQAKMLQARMLLARMLLARMLLARMLQARMLQARMLQSRKSAKLIRVGLAQFLVVTGGGMLNVSVPNVCALKDLATKTVAALTKQNFRLSRCARQALSWFGSQANVEFVMMFNVLMVLDVLVTSVAVMDQHVLQPLSTTLKVV